MFQKRETKNRNNEIPLETNDFWIQSLIFWINTENLDNYYIFGKTIRAWHVKKNIKNRFPKMDRFFNKFSKRKN